MHVFETFLFIFVYCLCYFKEMSTNLYEEQLLEERYLDLNEEEDIRIDKMRE